MERVSLTTAAQSNVALPCFVGDRRANSLLAAKIRRYLAVPVVQPSYALVKKGKILAGSLPVKVGAGIVEPEIAPENRAGDEAAIATLTKASALLQSSLSKKKTKKNNKQGQSQQANKEGKKGNSILPAYSISTSNQNNSMKKKSTVNTYLQVTGRKVLIKKIYSLPNFRRYATLFLRIDELIKSSDMLFSLRLPLGERQVDFLDKIKYIFIKYVLKVLVRIDKKNQEEVLDYSLENFTDKVVETALEKQWFFYYPQLLA